MIIISVKYQPSEKPDFTIKEDYMTFKGEGVGMSGKATYKFELSFYEPVESDKCRVKFTQSEVEFRLIKKADGIWPRLQASHERPHWIRLDFERWEYQPESDDEESDGGKEENLAAKAKVEAQLKELEATMKKQVESYDFIMNVLRKVKIAYLLIYNGIQWSGFILIVLALLKCLRGGKEGIQTTYEQTGDMMMFCHLLMQVEIIHAILGIVKSGVVSTILQVFGRFLMVFVVLVPAVEIHDHPIVFLLFLVWSLIEIIRYPYYALAVLNMEVNGLSWLRYTAWIPLYPVGFTCEATVVYLSLTHFDNSDDFSLTLPNSLNMSFSMSVVLRVALAVIPLIAYNQITHMFVQRKKKLGKTKMT